MSTSVSPNTSSTTRELIDHAVASIEAADCFSMPFPHIFFRDFFPKDFYAEMINALPEGGFERITGSGTRMALRLYGENIGKIDGHLRDMWTSVSETLTAPEVENAIRVQLNQGLEIRARGDKVKGAEGLKLVPKPVLYVDRDGYQIKPHPDTRKKVVTMQLYCPADESLARAGNNALSSFLEGAITRELVRAGAGQDLSVPAECRLRFCCPEGLPLPFPDKLAWASENQDED